jgi:hypothetical protein
VYVASLRVSASALPAGFAFTSTTRSSATSLSLNTGLPSKLTDSCRTLPPPGVRAP